MKRYIPAIMIGAICGLLIVSPALGGRLYITTAVRYDHSVDNATSETTGDEITLPFGIAYQAENFSLSVETALSNAYVKTGDDADSSISSLTDTLISGAYSYVFQDRPMAMMVGVDLNLPTGKERLTSEEKGAEWGQSNDLFEVDDFGEGLNIGVSLGLMYQFENAVAALQGAYIYNGEFDPTVDTDNDDLDPGDQILVVGFVDWSVSSNYTLSPFFAYSYFLADKTDGEKNFQEAQQLVVGSNLRMNYDPFGVIFNIQSTLAGKSKVIQDGALETEPEKSSGNDVFALLAATYQFSPTFNARLQGDVRYYGESELKDAQSGLPYSGKRVRYAVGPGFHYQIRSNLSCTGLFKFFTMGQDKDVFVKEDLTYNGLNIDLEMSYSL